MRISSRCWVAAALVCTPGFLVAQSPGGGAAPARDVTTERLLNAADEPGAWMIYGGNYWQQRYSKSNKISTKNVGQLVFAPGTSEDQVMEVALEAGADDVLTDEDGAIEVLTAPGEFEAVKNALQAAGLEPADAGVTMRPDITIELTGEDAERMQKLLDVLEDLDDVQEVFHNAAL